MVGGTDPPTLRDAIAEAMQDAWNDFTTDTGCFPDVFELRGKQLSANFDRGNFAQMVANYLAPALSVVSEQEKRHADEWIAACDEQGLPRDITVALFVQHHRANAQLTGYGNGYIDGKQLTLSGGVSEQEQEAARGTESGDIGGQQ